MCFSFPLFSPLSSQTLPPTSLALCLSPTFLSPPLNLFQCLSIYLCVYPCQCKLCVTQLHLVCVRKWKCAFMRNKVQGTVWMRNMMAVFLQSLIRLPVYYVGLSVWLLLNLMPASCISQLPSNLCSDALEACQIKAGCFRAGGVSISTLVTGLLSLSSALIPGQDY